MKRHIILVGLPGAGKTTVGRLAAALLGAEFTDLDDVIAGRAGKSIPEIFAQQGEAAFRALEASVGAEVFARPPAVIAVGGGFVADPVRRRLALASGLVIYLRISPGSAAGRLAGMTGRPLLDGRNTPERLAELLAQREAAYLESPYSVTTDGLGPDQVASAVATLARQRGGW